MFACVLSFCAIGFAQNNAASPPVRPGTAKMAALLEELNRKNDAAPKQNAFASDARAAWMRSTLSAIADPMERAYTSAEISVELLNAGEVDEALIEATNAVFMARQLAMPPRFYESLEFIMGLCHLRKGEQDNCIQFHGPESCLLPFRDSAIHKDQTGSRGAIAKFTEVLAKTNDFAMPARWLLNIAYMTVGEYPRKVPAQWLIPPSAFASDAPFPVFRNIAADIGLDQQGLAGGVVSDDFDNDGDIDVMVSRWGLREQLRLYRNDGNGAFTERTKEAGLTGLVGGLNMVQADYNNDGFVDVLVLRGAWLGAAGRYPDSLLRNNGDGTFEDVTHQAGMVSYHPSQTAAWFDYNGDGWIDVFIGNESSGGDENHPCELYRNNGDGTFTECAAENRLVIQRFVKAVVSADYNNDGRPDLYLSIRDGPNLLVRNQGPASTNDVQTAGARVPSRGAWRFGDVTRPAGVSEPTYSFSSWFFDYDNDGWQDLFVSGYRIRDVGDVAADYLGLPHDAERARLYHNNGNGTFTDVTKQMGLYRVLHTMGCNFGDLDNDGFLDFYSGTGDPNISTIIPNRMFRNDSGKKFQDVTSAGGFGHVQKGHGVAFADLDNDGDQDIYESIGGAYSGDAFRNVLFENPGTSNRWIGIKLEGVTSNRSAIGARLRLTAVSAQGEQRIFKAVNSGASFGANALRQHIGVGSSTNVHVEVFWPTTRARQVFTNLAPGKWYSIREDSEKAVVMDTKPFRFAKPADVTVTE